MKLELDEHTFLEKNVLFYTKLPDDKKPLFIAEIHEFLEKIKITPVRTTITDDDRLFLAAAAVIPIFNYPEWFYTTLDEVLIYESGFNEKFEAGENHPIQGMVGNRFLNNKMLLSKRALRSGFGNKTDKNNTAIHEFIHLIDMEDGAVDGIPEIFMEQQEVLPWMDLMYSKIKEIKENDSDIKAYGATNEAEFLSVAAEYFFERPELLKIKHTRLYALLDKIFNRQN